MLERFICFSPIYVFRLRGFCLFCTAGQTGTRGKFHFASPQNPAITARKVPQDQNSKLSFKLTRSYPQEESHIC